MTFTANIFLGYPIDSLLQQELDKASRQSLAFFIGENSEYLTVLHHEDLRYLGKVVDTPKELDSLELLEKNIFSLLSRVLPNFSFSSKLVIVPYLC